MRTDTAKLHQLFIGDEEVSGRGAQLALLAPDHAFGEAVDRVVPLIEGGGRFSDPDLATAAVASVIAMALALDNDDHLLVAQQSLGPVIGSSSRSSSGPTSGDPISGRRSGRTSAR
jgi:hypothetical protein